MVVNCENEAWYGMAWYDATKLTVLCLSQALAFSSQCHVMCVMCDDSTVVFSGDWTVNWI